MNANVRKKLVGDGHIRSHYGGRFEPISYLLTIILLLSYIYYSDGHKGLMFITSNPVMYLLIVFIIYCAFSFFIVARVHCLGKHSLDSFNKIKLHIQNKNLNIKSYGKYYIEANTITEDFGEVSVHMAVFYHDGAIYASAWKYARRSCHYVPFFTGYDQLESFENFLILNEKKE